MAFVLYIFLFRTRAGFKIRAVGKNRYAAEALGMTEQDLRTELQGGKTLAQVAQEKGVDTQKLVDAMLSQAKTDLAQQVANGRITQSQADQTLQELTTRIQTLINSGQPGRFGGWSGPPCIVGTEAQAS